MKLQENSKSKAGQSEKLASKGSRFDHLLCVYVRDLVTMCRGNAETGVFKGELSVHLCPTGSTGHGKAAGSALQCICVLSEHSVEVKMH